MPCGFGFTLLRAVRRYEFNQFDKIQTLILLLSAPCIVCFCGQELSTEVILLLINLQVCSKY
ncbi:hypothetical protein O3M35_009769 [Rhynocoris fuscipes]|uniref:NADH dehydrogenase subunit 1 n=1 Tax=Rhynocoris fuscipes TaxID=488301 RepID=A0AAW1DBP0_9HEMI